MWSFTVKACPSYLADHTFNGFLNVMDTNNFLWFNKFAFKINKQSCESQKMLMQWPLNIYYVILASGDLCAESIGFAKWVFLFLQTILPLFWWRFIILFYIFACKIQHFSFMFTKLNIYGLICAIFDNYCSLKLKYYLNILCLISLTQKFITKAS